MLLTEITAMRSNALTVRVDQEFSDATLDFDVADEWDDIADVPEQLNPLMYVVTQTEGDYRSLSDELTQTYGNTPELAYFVGARSGKLYQQDLVNIPNTVFLLSMPVAQFNKLIGQHIINEPGTSVRH